MRCTKSLRCFSSKSEGNVAEGAGGGRNVVAFGAIGHSSIPETWSFLCVFLTAACKLHPTRMNLTFWIHLDAILPQDCVVGTVLVTTYQSCQLHDTVYIQASIYCIYIYIR